MATFCKNKKLGCLESTMQKCEEDEYKCDMCWEVENAVMDIHTSILEMNDNEPLDGDQTATLAKVFLSELNKLNGNK